MKVQRVSWCFQLLSVATALSFLVSQNRMRILPRAWCLRLPPHVTKAETVEKATVPNSERKYPATKEKNPGWKAPEISHINFQHFFCLQTTQNSLISKWFIQSLYENCYKRCLKVIVWKNVNRFEKQGLFKEKRQYQRECQNTSGKKRCWCCSQHVFHWFEVKRKWRKTWILHTLWNHKKQDIH